MKRNKRMIIFTSLLITMLLITGCGKEIEVKNGSKVAVSVSKNKFTATGGIDAKDSAGIKTTSQLYSSRGYISLNRYDWS